jgi:GPH family glycoside/pentoside/hexuronide:cation symporter
MFKKIKAFFFGPDLDEKFKVAPATKIKLGLGNFGFTISSGLVGAWLLNFYIKIVKIDPILWAWAWIAYLVWNAINDPLVGWLSDRTRTRWGRRIPWLMVSVPLIPISFIMLFFPPILDHTEIGVQIIYFIWLLAGLALFDTFYTIWGLCQGALVAELSIEPTERINMSLWGAFGLGIGLALTYLIPFMVIVNEEPYSQNLGAIQTVCLLFSIVGLICLAIMAFGIKERKEFCFAEEEIMPFWTSIKYTFKDKAFLINSAAGFMIGYIQLALVSMISFYVQDVLLISGNDIMASLPMLLFIGAMILGFPIGIIFNERYGGKKAIIYLSILVITGLILLTFAVEIVLTNICLIILGTGYSASTLVLPTLMADIVDLHELKTGYRREGAYFGSGALLTKPSQSLANFLIGLVFVLTGYNQDLLPGQTQTDLAIFGVKLNIGLIPGIFALIAILILWKFPIDGSKPEYKEWKKKIEKIHDKKLEALRAACLSEE